MRFGLFYQASEAPEQTHADRYAEMFDLIALGDTLGFDVAWLAELHLRGACPLPADRAVMGRPSPPPPPPPPRPPGNRPPPPMCCQAGASSSGGVAARSRASSTAFASPCR